MRHRALTACAVALFFVATSPARAAGPPRTNCFWSDAADRTHNNILLPDASATYWHAQFILPRGAHIVLRGRYPHARSFFTWAYESWTPTNGLNDALIEPDPNAVNPFVAGASRTGADRSYTLTITGRAPPRPGGRYPSNTIYVDATGFAGLPREAHLPHRIYLPDQNRDVTGDAGLPTAALITRSGDRLTGEAACAALGSEGGRLPNPTMLAAPLYLSLVALGGSPTHPAASPGRWYPLINPDRLLEPFYTGTPGGWLLNQVLPRTRSGPVSMHPEADSGFIYSYVDRSLGPAPGGHNVLVLRGRLPTTPRTSGGETRMAGGTQMRFWPAHASSSARSTAS